MLTTVERIAKWVAGLRFEDLPGRIVERARAQRLSVWGGAAAGMALPCAGKILAVARGENEFQRKDAETQCEDASGVAPLRLSALASKSPAGAGARRGATFVPTGERMDVRGVVLATGALATAFDYDEIVLVGHTGQTAAALPWALVEAAGGNPLTERAAHERAVVAQVAAVEVMGRLGLATFFGPQNGQMLPYLHQVGAAIAAAKVWGLDADATANAIGLALLAPPAPLWPAFLSPLDAKLFITALPALTGLDCAQLARAGITAARDAFDNAHGFFQRFTTLSAPNALTGFGRAWLFDTLSVKAWPACWYFQTAIQAARDIAQKHGPLAFRDVRAVSVDANLLGCAVDAHSALLGESALTPNRVNFSLALTVALTLMKGDLDVRDLGAEALSASATGIGEWNRCITVRHSLDHSLAVLQNIDAMLDLVGLIGASPLAIAKAWRAAKAYFPSVPSFSGRSERPWARVAKIALALPGVARRFRARGAYDLGERDLSRGKMPMGATVRVEFANGTTEAATVDLHEGAHGSTVTPLMAAEKKFERHLGETLGAWAADFLSPKLDRR
ncbi:MAG: MmgE/PrpD family protein [Deltaproteobacteria bacterium]|nr:MmgE/PrpD family protein [Deltaproteobacteria bacterium]